MYRRPKTHTSRRLRSHYLPALAVLLTASVAVVVGGGTVAATTLVSHDDGVAYAAGGDQSQAPDIAATTGAFGISGNVKGLYPGAKKSLILEVTNHESFNITVTKISTTIHSMKNGCSSSNLSVSTFSGHLSVAANGTRFTTVQAMMAHSAPNVCQGATFALQYSGTATK